EAVSTPLEATAQEALGKLRSRELFQSTWDTAAFIIFLIFLGECGLGLWPPRPPPGRPPGPLLQERPRGVDNLALEP
uniref:Uncharacterized protein n=1 Tax=Ursus americanus TaxID=9643 RepID=A0A452RNS6_URSAM